MENLSSIAFGVGLVLFVWGVVNLFRSGKRFRGGLMLVSGFLFSGFAVGVEDTEIAPYLGACLVALTWAGIMFFKPGRRLTGGLLGLGAILGATALAGVNTLKQEVQAREAGFESYAEYSEDLLQAARQEQAEREAERRAEAQAAAERLATQREEERLQEEKDARYRADRLSQAAEVRASALPHYCDALRAWDELSASRTAEQNQVIALSDEYWAIEEAYRTRIDQVGMDASQAAGIDDDLFTELAFIDDWTSHCRAIDLGLVALRDEHVGTMTREELEAAAGSTNAYFLYAVENNIETFSQSRKYDGASCLFGSFEGVPIVGCQLLANNAPSSVWYKFAVGKVDGFVTVASLDGGDFLEDSGRTSLSSTLLGEVGIGVWAGDPAIRGSKTNVLFPSQ